MTESESRQEPVGGGGDPFETTHWSVVVAAGQDSSPEARHALATLCQKYWGPLYAFVRRRGYSVEDAQDITQGFFAQFIEGSALKDVTPERGKFRAYLLTSLKNYMVSEQRRAKAQKRGGGEPPLSLDFGSAEGSYRLEPAERLTPEKLYELRWAMTLLNAILDLLGREYADAGKGQLFDTLRPCLTGEDDALPYRNLAQELSMTEGAVKTAVYRLRRRFGDLLREEIAQTVANADDVEREMEDLFLVLG